MKRTALIVVVSFLAGMGAEYLRQNISVKWVPHHVDEKDTLRVVQEDRSKNWEGGLDRLGIKQGDILLAVNGVTDPTMLQELVNGINRGKACVTYERAGARQEICWEKKTN